VLPILSVIGKSKSGKTTLIEYIISHLSKEGLKIGTVKHVHHSGFSIDAKGKDTWRHSLAGAKIVVCIAPEETAIIKKTSPPNRGLEAVLEIVRDEKLDLLIIEGFHSWVSKRNDILKIITAKNKESLRRTLEGTTGPILLITGPIARNEVNLPGVEIPLIDLNERGEEIIRRVRATIQRE
jgi:molybdopterin-guanine dinucleotide biosynthesis protein MobB